jgi:5,8-dihydroxy-2-naphthoate synthase
MPPTQATSQRPVADDAQHGRTLRIGHSPDPDDAFMWYPLANFDAGQGPGGKAYSPRIDTGPYDFVHVLEDIQSLNDRAERGDLEITAISIHQYPYVADRYALTRCGASMGDGYGPMVVSRQKMDQQKLTRPRTGRGRRPRLAIPGKRTSAWLALQLLLHEHGVRTTDQRPFTIEVVPFDQIIPGVVRGQFEAGLIIHEGQLTYAEAELHCVVDLGKWWTDSRRLPLPLGGNAIRRDLGHEACREVCTILQRSIEYALAHRDDAIAYALNYARDMGRELADQFVGMYVNKWTLDYGEVGRRAVQQFIREGIDAGLVPDRLPAGDVDFVQPG